MRFLAIVLALLIGLSSVSSSAQTPPINRDAYRAMVRQLERAEDNGFEVFHYRVEPYIRLPTNEEIATLIQPPQNESRRRRTGNLAGAAEDRRRAMAIYDLTFGPEHPVSATGSYWLAQYAEEMRQWDEGEAHWR